jgi:hypothetical protein
VKKEQNERKSIKRLKPTVGCNASKRRRITWEEFCDNLHSLTARVCSFLSLIVLADVSGDIAFEYPLDGPQGRTRRSGEE